MRLLAICRVMRHGGGSPRNTARVDRQGGTMDKLQEQLARLRGYNRALQEGDPKLAEESRDLMSQVEVATDARPEDVEQQIELESIAMRRERPVLAIKENLAQLVFVDEADSQIWRERLKAAKPLFDTTIPAVGRIDLKGGQLDWVGTGWLVAENILVTNRHVAREFVVRKGEGFTFKMGLTGQMSGAIDFLQEIDNPRGWCSAWSGRCTSRTRRDRMWRSSRSRWCPATRSSRSRSTFRPISH